MIQFELHPVAPIIPASAPYLAAVLRCRAHPACKFPDDQREHLTVALGHAPSAGYIIECGVATGYTINHLASLQPHRTVWGFDSFFGLPEHWNEQHPLGTFSRNGEPPEVASNVRLCVGMFADTIPKWKAAHAGNIAFLHVDCDLYTSATTVLSEFNERLIPGSIIAFDDLHEFDRLGPNPPDEWQSQEWRAMEEWSERCNRKWAIVSRLRQCCLAIRVLQ